MLLLLLVMMTHEDARLCYLQLYHWEPKQCCVYSHQHAAKRWSSILAWPAPQALLGSVTSLVMQSCTCSAYSVGRQMSLQTQSLSQSCIYIWSRRDAVAGFVMSFRSDPQLDVPSSILCRYSATSQLVSQIPIVSQRLNTSLLDQHGSALQLCSSGRM